MASELFSQKEEIRRAFALAKDERPAYKDLFPFLEALFILQSEAEQSINLSLPGLDLQLVGAKWQEGFPLLRRWDFPIDTRVAESILTHLGEYVSPGNKQMRSAYKGMREFLKDHPDRSDEFWQGFLQHEWEPWEEWLDSEAIDVASLLLLARSCIRPSVEYTARQLTSIFQVPESWHKGYCPVCGSLPSLLYLSGEGARRGYCSWCATNWDLHRMQCPYCDNRLHDSLGYLYIEEEPRYHVHYCRLCSTYFKQIDTRDLLYPPYFPLEEWTTLHLDLLAQRAGWKQPSSPSPIVYKESEVDR